MADLDAAGQLYALPLAEFTSARNQLAARLRKAGDRASADAVKALAKPSVSAWALNQVALRQPELVEALLAAGRDLAQAQKRLLAGGGQAEFRAANQAEKAALAKIVQAAGAVLAPAGHSPSKPMLDRLEATARAAAADSEGGDLLRAGRLTSDLDPTSFGALGGFDLPSAPIPFPRPPAAGGEPAVPGSDRQERLSAAREEVHRLQRDVQALRQQASQAEGEAARARQATAKADREWAAARNAAARAETLAGDARRVEQDAAEALAALRARIDQTVDELERAEAGLRQLRG